MFEKHEIPVAYSMIALAKQLETSSTSILQIFCCYWIAFNNIYSTLAERGGFSVRFRTKNGAISTKKNGGVYIPLVDKIVTEKQEIEQAYDKLHESLKIKLIKHSNTRFFVERIPQWNDEPIKFDAQGQKLNGVINVGYTSDKNNPVWSPLDLDAYNRIDGPAATPDDVNLLAYQLLFLLYTVRNNTFHGGKRADDANDCEVLEHALPLLKMIVDSFMIPAE